MSRVTAVWSTAVVGLSLVLAAIPLLLMDARANDGAASMTALFGIPLLAVGVLIELQRPRGGERRWVIGMLPWAGGLVVGMLLLGIAAMILEPRYYEAETQGGMFATLAMFLVIMAFGAACGIVFWGLVVLPIATLVRAVGTGWRGEKADRRGLAFAGGSLGVVAVVTAIVVLTAERPDELVFAQMGAILLGLPLGPLAYEPPPEIAVWILRLLLGGILAVAGVLTALWARPADPAQLQTR